MKAFLFVALLALAPACAKKNDVATLRHEAVSVARYYTPRLDALDARVQHIFKRGSSIPANLPGIDAVGARLTEARDMIVQLRGIVGPGPDGKSAVEKQADAAARDGKVHDLEKLVHDTHSTLDRGVTIINDDLLAVESWIAQYDRQSLAMNTAQPPGSSPSNTGQPPGASPEGQPGAGGAGNPAGGTQTGGAGAQPGAGATTPGGPGATQPAGGAQPAPGSNPAAGGPTRPNSPQPPTAQPPGSGTAGGGRPAGGGGSAAAQPGTRGAGSAAPGR